MRMEYRWAPGSADIRRQVASELVALAPDVILANGSGGTEPLLQVTRTLPIVFVLVPDPVAAGYVDSLARPGGNATGFISYDYSMGGKWLELLKQIAPRVTRVGVLRDIGQVAAVGQFSAIQSVAPSLGVEAIPVNVRDADGIENAISGFASAANGGLIVTGSGLAVANRNLIITRTAQHSCPQSIGIACSFRLAAWSRMGPICATNFGKRHRTSIASLKARSPPTCRCRPRPISTR